MGMKELLHQQLKTKDTGVVGPLERYLFKKTTEPNDRAIDVNAPSSAGGCMRAGYYKRKQYPIDAPMPTRTYRIFDNGNHVHVRLQGYLMSMHLLVMDEVPLINDKYNIQGHTDGYLDFVDEIAILEIKSINDTQFKQLKDAKPEHKCQGLIYLYCAEERRQYLKKTYKTKEEFDASAEERKEYFRKHYQHIKGGKKHTREEKIEFEVALNMESDEVLYAYDKPVSKVIFLYENKNDQNLKEFVIERNEDTQVILDTLLEEYIELNKCCDEDKVPPRPKGATKSGCRYCDYRNTCFVS